MKIFRGFLFPVCAFFAFGMTACGSGYAKITGIRSGIVLSGEGTFQTDEKNPLTEKSTVCKNDYLLTVGETQDLLVCYLASGGSKYPILTEKQIKLYYDSKILDIQLKEQQPSSDVVQYELTCKCAIDYTAIMIEVDGMYSDTIVLNAK